MRVIGLVAQDAFGFVETREQECPIPVRENALRRDVKPGLGLYYATGKVTARGDGRGLR